MRESGHIQKQCPSIGCSGCPRILDQAEHKPPPPRAYMVVVVKLARENWRHLAVAELNRQSLRDVMNDVQPRLRARVPGEKREVTLERLVREMKEGRWSIRTRFVVQSNFKGVWPSEAHGWWTGVTDAVGRSWLGCDKRP